MPAPVRWAGRPGAAEAFVVVEDEKAPEDFSREAKKTPAPIAGSRARS
jgi:hypothetical protein